jgi:hypothetical protein
MGYRDRTMRTFGFAIRPVMDGAATITQKEVEISRETAASVFPDWESASKVARVLLESPSVSYVRIERVTLLEGLMPADAEHKTVQ